MKRAIIVDLDGTLCDSGPRKHLVDGPEKPNYDEFYKAAIFDYPNQFAAEIVRRFSVDHSILYVSGRPEEYRALTEEWLSRHGLDLHEKLFMRETGNYEADNLLKERIFMDQIAGNYRVLFALDDRQRVVDMWRKHRLRCLQCAKGDF